MKRAKNPLLQPVHLDHPGLVRVMRHAVKYFQLLKNSSKRQHSPFASFLFVQFFNFRSRFAHRISHFHQFTCDFHLTLIGPLDLSYIQSYTYLHLSCLIAAFRKLHVCSIAYQSTFIQCDLMLRMATLKDAEGD